MITLIEAKNFRCLRYVSRPLGDFHVLVGPNASGKTTFLGVIAFLGKLASSGLEAAINERTSNFQDLLWNRTGDGFELAIEARIPDDRRALLANQEFDTIRYEVSIGIDPATSETAIIGEKALLKTESNVLPRQDSLFPTPKEALEAAIRVTRKQRSSSLYYDLATRVGLGGCTDRAFVKLKETLKSWFAAGL